MGLETIREGVALETREHGPATGAETLVVWGHGLCNSMGGEDIERLWDFWRCPDGDPFAETARVVRYHARGHGLSSRASSPDECTWEALGDDMLALARLKRGALPTPSKGDEASRGDGISGTRAETVGAGFARARREKLVLGGASMGSASAVFAAKRARDEALSNRLKSNDDECYDDLDDDVAREIDGLVLVIVPTMFEARRARSRQIESAAARGFDATAARRKPRPIFKDTPRANEPATPLGVRADSFASVMRASAMSDFPDEETLRRTFSFGDADRSASRGGKTRVLVLCWDCGDATHPASSAAALRAAIPHAHVEIATSLEQVGTWGETIRGFIRSL